MLAHSAVDEVSIELAGSRVPPDVLGKAGDKRVAVGAIDVTTDTVETPEEVRATLEVALGYLPPERLVASTNCGMAPMKRSVAMQKLAALGAGAELARHSHRMQV